MKLVFKLYFIVYLLILILFLHNCNLFQKSKYIYESIEIYKRIPDKCNIIKGINRKIVQVARNEQELIQFYGMTNLVYFNNEQSPILYGSLYYFDFENDTYCMALANGYFAVIHNKNKNMIQEICYPLNECEIYDEKRNIYNILK